MAVLKWDRKEGLTLHEGLLGERFQRIPVAVPHTILTAVTYSADGKELFVAAASPSPDDSKPNRLRDSALLAVSLDAHQTVRTIMEYVGDISELHPLEDGSIAFHGAVRVLLNSQPIGGSRSWTNYRWKLRQPDGAIVDLLSKEEAFSGKSSLIQDRVLVSVNSGAETGVRDGRGVMTKDYGLQGLELRQGADVQGVARMANVRDAHGGPRIACGWNGDTCLRSLAFDKNGYYAHRAELFVNGTACEIPGLPDRLEQLTIARDGSVVAFIARPSPRSTEGYRLVYARSATACLGKVTFAELP